MNHYSFLNLFITRCIWVAVWAFLLTACQGESSKTSEEASDTSQAESQTSKVPTDYLMPTLDENNARTHLLNYGEANPGTEVVLKTDLGDIKIKLFEETPLHRANFIYLSKKGFYNGVPFYRVIKDFMIQAGAGNFPQREAAKTKIGNYSIPDEYLTEKYFHVRGAVAMTKPEKIKQGQGSTPYDFYIVQGQKYTEGQLKAIAQRDKVSFTPAQKQAYISQGGVPELDGKHTVFGRVLEGMEIVDKIAALEVRPEDQAPKQLVGIKVEILK